MTTKGTDYVLPYESVDAIFLAHLDLVHRQKSRCPLARSAGLNETMVVDGRCSFQTTVSR
jgi:hypothetical protein